MGAPYSIVVDRICGTAELEVHVADDGQHQAWLRMPELRGFEAFLRGRPAEELPHLASRISAVCPWPHHLAALMAVEKAMGITTPPCAQKVRELGLMLSSLSDRLLLFYVTNAPDLTEGEIPNVRTFFNLTQHPYVRQAMLLRTRLQRVLFSQSGPDLPVGNVVVGGLIRPVHQDLVHTASQYVREIRDFCTDAIERGREAILPILEKELGGLDNLQVPMLGSVRSGGALALWNGNARYMQADGSYEDMDPADFMNDLVEEYADWTQCAFPHRKGDGPVRLDVDAPSGVYRVGALPRINACTRISTPMAQAALEDFRSSNGPRPQASMLYHWARYIEMLHACERAEELLNDPELLSTEIREENILPSAGVGVAKVEAPRGSLFYKVDVDYDGIIRMCDIIPPTTQNNAAMCLSLTQAARKIITTSPPSAEDWHRLSMFLRTYDPCPACAVH